MPTHSAPYPSPTHQVIILFLNPLKCHPTQLCHTERLLTLADEPCALPPGPSHSPASSLPSAPGLSFTHLSKDMTLIRISKPLHLFILLGMFFLLLYFLHI